MRKETAKRIASVKSRDEVAEWQRSITKAVGIVHPHFRLAMKAVCGTCPFRESRVVGGCIKTDCPVNVLMHELELTPKRGGAAAKAIYSEMN